MFDKETKIFLWFIAFMVVIVLPIIVVAMVRLENHTDWCTEQGGVMLKSAAGWRCFDVKVLK